MTDSNAPRIRATISQGLYDAMIEQYGDTTAQTIRIVLAKGLGYDLAADEVEHGGKRDGAGRKPADDSAE